jgi:hypothetical protein
MTSPQFPRNPRAPGRNDPVTRDELMRKCESWAHLVSQLDDYRIAGNARGVRRILNRLHYSVRNVRDRYEPSETFAEPFDAQAWERRALGEEIAAAREADDGQA